MIKHIVAKDKIPFDRKSYLPHLRGQAQGLTGTIVPFTLVHGLTTEVGATAAGKIMDAIVAELFDPETGRGILDPDNVSVEELRAAVDAQLQELLGPVCDALQVLKDLEDAVLPDFVEEILDDLEVELAEYVESISGDEIRDAIHGAIIPEAFEDELCESNE